jgi:hypothetical protein
MSAHLLSRPLIPSSRSMMGVSAIMSSISVIINAFRDSINDLKTVEEIAMKKPKTVADLLTVADVCIDSPGSTSGVSWQGVIKKKG